MINGNAHELVGMREGDVVAGKYRVERVLGTGGMGVVVAAHHIQLDEKFAIKFLRPDALDHAELVARFAREARAAAKIKSEHVARVVDVGALPNGAPYMVMEYLEGGDLDAWIEERGPLAIEQAVEFLLQACVGVADVHALGIVHRDLKPANLFCVRRSDGQFSIKLLDFGISKSATPELGTQEEALRMTQPLGQMGSPSYMSPEQMRCSTEVDLRTDIWSLGVILYELLAAASPFRATTVTELAIEVATAPTPSILDYRPDVTPELDAVIRKCLEKQPSDRYANAAELALALKPFAPERAASLVARAAGIIATSSGPVISASPSAFPPPAVLPGWQRMNTTARLTRASSGLKRVLIGSFCALALAVLMGSIWRRVANARKAPPPVASAPTQQRSVADARGSAHPQKVHAPASARQPDSDTTAIDSAQHESVALEPSPVAKPRSADSRSRKQPVAEPPVRGVARRQRPVAKPTAPNCDPPYYFDANGNRLFKKECV